MNRTLLCLCLAVMVTACAVEEEDTSEITQLQCNCDIYPQPCCCNTPILLDLDGDGIELTSWREGVEFPMVPARGRDMWAWTATGSDDAWLSIDLNDNGVIDRGSELFGPGHESKNGFVVLAERDSNGDRLIDERDYDFHRLRLWQDLNHDGAGQLEELRTLSEVGITSLDTRYQETRQSLGHGNAVRYIAPLTTTEDSTVSTTAYDVLLSRATADERKESGLPDPVPWEGNKVIPTVVVPPDSEEQASAASASTAQLLACVYTINAGYPEVTGSTIKATGYWTPSGYCPPWLKLVMKLYERQQDGVYEEKAQGVAAERMPGMEIDVSRGCPFSATASWKSKTIVAAMPPNWVHPYPLPTKLSEPAIRPCKTWTVANPCD
jgi:hypothetical protein